MCTYSQMREERALEKGIRQGEKRGKKQGIAIYKTLLETRSVEQTAARLSEPIEEVREIAETYQVGIVD